MRKDRSSRVAIARELLQCRLCKKMLGAERLLGGTHIASVASNSSAGLRPEGRGQVDREGLIFAILARQLHKQGMVYRAISAKLERAGHVNERGKPFHHKSVRARLEVGDHLAAGERQRAGVGRPPWSYRGKQSGGKRPPDTEPQNVVPEVGGGPVGGGRGEVLGKVGPGTA